MPKENMDEVGSAGGGWPCLPAGDSMNGVVANKMPKDGGGGGAVKGRSDCVVEHGGTGRISCGAKNL